jgi:hypothetical protein
MRSLRSVAFQHTATAPKDGLSASEREVGLCESHGPGMGVGPRNVKQATVNSWAQYGRSAAEREVGRGT